jgi:cellulose synthase/poly-beta-1,6-N-acetylglucosamine synthase-like glycosyltransferase
MTDLISAQGILFGLVLTNAVACFLLTGLQILSAARPAPDFHRRHHQANVLATEETSAPFFSVHVPTHNEPPDVVIATLEHLSKLDYEQFEVIVLDNNTSDPAMWRPVEEACKAMGPRFRFSHHDNVVGAKAGALNLAATMACRQATHFAIVDADYQVTPDFLTSAASAVANSRADFVQFPQAYRNQAQAPNVATELADYFLIVANGTNRQQAMLLTGTLSIIARDAFDAVGGWSGATITEDAELGVRLYLGKHRGAYIQKTVGRGMLPLDFTGLTQQRDRWVTGNVQTLLGAMRAGLLPSNKAALAIWSQLTAWVGLCAVPAFALLVMAFLPNTQGLAEMTAVLAGLTILVSLLSNPIRWNQNRIEHPQTLSTWLGVRRVKLALLWTSSLAWVPILFGSKPIFVRTPKCALTSTGVFMPGLAMVSLVFGAVSLVHFYSGNIVSGFSSAVLASCWLAARCVDRELSSARQSQSGRASA